MLDIIRASPGCGVGEVCERFDMSRIGAMKHLRVLEEARLVLSRKEGRTRRLYVNAAPIQMIHDRWMSAWSALWASEVTQLKYRVETGAGGAPGKTSRRTARTTGKKAGGARKKSSLSRGATTRKRKYRDG